ncbi:MAG: beta-ketoacyl-[acyl-carrier-protein] synthase family protein [Pseudomonadota bacterium]
MGKRVVITGMAVNTALGHTLEDFYASLMANRSGITKWRSIDTGRVYGKVGGDLADFDTSACYQSLAEKVPEDVSKRLKRLMRRAPWATKITMLLAVEVFRHAGLFETDFDPTNCPLLIAAHNQNSNYIQGQYAEFEEEPEYIDPLFSLHALDTDHGGSVSEVLQTKGPMFTVGGACASGSLALRLAVDEVRYRDADHALVVAPLLDIAPMDLHGMALMGAISYVSFNEEPERASRPYDMRREGFVPSHGAGALVVESLERAEARGATIYAEILSVEANSDGNHLPQPSREGQARLMKKALSSAGVAPDEIDFVSAHATSTPLGDVTELGSIKDALGNHAYRTRINAPKSLLGHTCWSAPTVETIAAILQMRAGRIHRSINIDELDPEVDLDVTADGNVDLTVRRFMKNSFGFGGINCVGVFADYDQD